MAGDFQGLPTRSPASAVISHCHFRSLGVLSHLSLRQNGIVDEDCERVVELCALITLNLSHNRFRAVSALSSHLPPRLSRLSLAHNMISTLPNDFSCSKLLDLDVSSNCLVGTVTLPLLPCLRTLKLSGNAITTLRGLDGMPQLDLLDISHNSVPDVQDLCGIRECRMLGKLHGAGNPFADCPRYRYAMYDYTSFRYLCVAPSSACCGAGWRRSRHSSCLTVLQSPSQSLRSK